MGWNVAEGGRVNMTTAPGRREITPMPGPPFARKPTLFGEAERLDGLPHIS